jgi:hypothetical protein
MSVVPFPIQVLRDSKWSTIQSDELMPGDMVSIGELYTFRVNDLLTFRQSSLSFSGDECPCGYPACSGFMYRE